MIVRSIFLAIVLFATISGTALAKPDEPPLPKWATVECVQTIERIVMHETGYMDEEAWRFVAEQVIHDIRVLGCGNLTRWRWKIGNYPLKKVSPEVIGTVWGAIADYPFHRYPICRFVGYPGDVAEWKNRGYSVKIDYRHDYKSMSVIGVNCKQWR